VNSAEVEVDDRYAKTPLLWVLRDVLAMHGTKFGCGSGFCAACTVLIDGKNTKSCQTPAERAVGKAVTTVEGASGPVVDAVRDAWYRGNVLQCGYCQPGQTLAAISLLGSNPAPDDAAIDLAMNGNMCRCCTYPRIKFSRKTSPLPDMQIHADGASSVCLCQDRQRRYNAVDSRIDGSGG
jgi:aerobic-type carbon monoxide dehydrogenase small subunit (CoxS/CutS family)